MNAFIFVFTSLAVAANGRRINPESIQYQSLESARALSEILLAVNPGNAALPHGSGRVTSIPRRTAVSMGLKVGDKFPSAASKKFGVSGKKAVVFFYGADDAPSCKKQISAFSDATAAFKKAGFTCVGVRNAAGVKANTDAAVKLVVDDDDAVRKEIGIAKDLFGFLGGRETYVLDASGTIIEVHNNQFDPESHIKVALAATEKIPAATNPFEGLFR